MRELAGTHGDAPGPGAMMTREVPRCGVVRGGDEERGVLKWRLLLTTLPVVAAVLIAKVLLTAVFDFDGLIDFTDVALVLTGASS